MEVKVDLEEKLSQEGEEGVNVSEDSDEIKYLKGFRDFLPIREEEW